MTDKETKQAENVAIAALEEKEQGETYTTANGYRVRFRPVGVGLLQKIAASIPDPIVPVVEHPDDKTRKIENPMDPKYRQAVRDAEAQRQEAMMNALFLRSIELVDGVPEDREWLEDLLFLGVLTQEEIDNATPKHIVLWFKKHIVSDIETQNRIMSSMGLNEGQVAEARKTFQGRA